VYRAIRPMSENTTMTASSLIARGAAITIAIAGLTGFAFWAHDSAAAQDPFAMHAAGAMPHSAEHIAKLSEHINAEAGTTPQQKAKIDALLEQAGREFEPAHAQLQENHELVISILSQDRIDRAELENVRQDSVRLADQASLRMTQLVADIADVLTPAQRKALAARARQHHTGHMGRHGG
jgi:periplasmic protein CpxP/Spy